MSHSNQSFNHFLRERGADWDVRSLLYHIARSVKYINFSIRAGNTGGAGTENASGESQIAMDVLADNIIRSELEKSEIAKVIASEEQDESIEFESHRGNYFVAYDPLDGSSLVDANLAIGTIFGIWESPDMIGHKAGDGMVAACYAVYGPRITLTIALKDKGCHEFELNDVGEFILTRADITIQDDTTYFAPGNLKVCSENPKYRAVMDRWLNKQSKLRYSGGMVPDLHHILSKGHGIFTYPSDKKLPNGKLRLLFEGAPFAFVFNEANGVGKNEEGNDILDTIVTDYHQNTTVFIGSKNEVKVVTDLLN
jgi:fructose-1,6-bisphosphatase I